jgi:lipopolysaccharide exporter
VSLRGKAIAGALWNVATSVGGRVAGVLGTLVITWFLAPDVVGEVSVASILVLSTRLFVGLGIGQYLAAHPAAPRNIVFHVTILNLVLTAIAAGAILLLAAPLGVWLGAPDAARYVPWLTLSMVVGAFADVPERLLVRDLRFRAFGLTLGAAEALYAVVTVACAAGGAGGMAIVYGNLARAGFRLVVALVVVDPRVWLTPSRLGLRAIGDIVAFGAPLQIGAIASHAAYRWDNLIVSHLFGPGPTATYNLAFNLANIPAENIGESAADVLLPSFAHLPRERRPAALARACALLALVIFPLALGLAAVAETLVPTLFNEKWRGVAAPLVLLAGFSVVHPIADVVRSYFQAAGTTRAPMLMQVAYALLVLPSVYLGGQLGLRGAAVGAGVSATLYSLAGVWLLGRLAGVAPRALLASYARPLLPCAVMILAVLATRHGLGALGVGTGWARLVCEIAVGGIVYIPAALLLAREPALELLRILRERRRRQD